MKQIISFLLLLLLLGCNNYNMINEPGLKGSVKEYTDYKMRVEYLGGNNSITDTIYISTSKLNRDGKIKEFNQLTANLDTISSYINIFDPQGRVIEKKEYFNDNEIVVKYFYKDTLLQKSHSRNKLIKGLIHEAIYKYSYDDNGKLLKRTILNTIIENKDTVSLNWVYKYDSNELLSEAISLDNNEHYSMKKATYKYTYDDLKLPLKVVGYDENDSIIGINEYKYKFDKNGSCIEIEKYENDTLKYLTTRTIEYQ